MAATTPSLSATATVYATAAAADGLPTATTFTYGRAFTAAFTARHDTSHATSTITLPTAADSSNTIAKTDTTAHDLATNTRRPAFTSTYTA